MVALAGHISAWNASVDMQAVEQMFPLISGLGRTCVPARSAGAHKRGGQLHRAHVVDSGSRLRPAGASGGPHHAHASGTGRAGRQPRSVTGQALRWADATATSLPKLGRGARRLGKRRSILCPPPPALCALPLEACGCYL
jgi:hypothetical protein